MKKKEMNQQWWKLAIVKIFNIKKNKTKLQRILWSNERGC